VGLSTGERVLDATDFKAWLLKLADRAEAAGTVEEFFSGLKRITSELPAVLFPAQV
jgi:hypothetical protein